jgi:CBS domain-containing protein
MRPAVTLTTVTEGTLPIPGEDPWFADPQDAAICVMTDFRERASVTVSETAQVDDALEHMKHAGVRSAFVIDQARAVVVGLVTAYDIMGEKPMALMQLGSPRRDVLVRNLMQPIADWRVADMRDLERATVADVAAMFAETGRTHIPVIERGDNGEKRLRGLLSGARVRRLLAHRATVDRR